MLPGVHYWPGLGLIVGFLLLLGAGLVVNAYVVRWFLAQWDKFLEHIPLVKTVYGALRDAGQVPPIAKQAPRPQARGGGEFRRSSSHRFRRPRVGTRARETQAAADGMVGVYFPMSYQIGATLFTCHARGLLRSTLASKRRCVSCSPEGCRLPAPQPGQQAGSRLGRYFRDRRESVPGGCS